MVRRGIMVFLLMCLATSMFWGLQANATNFIQPNFLIVSHPALRDYYATTPDGAIAVQLWSEFPNSGSKYYYTIDGTDPQPGISNEIKLDERIYITKPGKTIFKAVEIDKNGRRSFTDNEEYELWPGANFVLESADMRVNNIAVSGKNIAFFASKAEDGRTFGVYCFLSETNSIKKIAEYTAESGLIVFEGNYIVYSIYIPNKDYNSGNSTIYCYNTKSGKITQLTNSPGPKRLYRISNGEVIFGNSSGTYSINLLNQKVNLIEKGEHYGAIWNNYFAWTAPFTGGKETIKIKNLKTGKVVSVPAQPNAHSYFISDFNDGILVYNTEGYEDATRKKRKNNAAYFNVLTQNNIVFKENSITNANISNGKIYFADSGLSIGSVYDISTGKIDVVTPRTMEGPVASESLVAWTRSIDQKVSDGTHYGSSRMFYGLFYKDLNSPPLPDRIAPSVILDPQKLYSQKFTEPLWASLNINEKGQIMYRLDGGEWREYKKPFYIDRTTEVEYYATDLHGNKSPVGYYKYNFSPDYVPPISVKINNNPLTVDIPPELKNGRVLVPLRAIFEELGATVEWDPSIETITATKLDTEIKLRIGNNTTYINKQANTIDVAPMIVKGRTLVPIRFVSEAFGAEVSWDAVNRQVIITH